MVLVVVSGCSEASLEAFGSKALRMHVLNKERGTSASLNAFVSCAPVSSGERKHHCWSAGRRLCPITIALWAVVRLTSAVVNARATVLSCHSWHQTAAMVNVSRALA